jgi:hypothetical protein
MKTFCGDSNGTLAPRPTMQDVFTWFKTLSASAQHILMQDARRYRQEHADEGVNSSVAPSFAHEFVLRQYCYDNHIKFEIEI